MRELRGKTKELEATLKKLEKEVKNNEENNISDDSKKTEDAKGLLSNIKKICGLK